MGRSVPVHRAGVQLTDTLLIGGPGGLESRARISRMRARSACAQEADEFVGQRARLVGKVRN